MKKNFIFIMLTVVAVVACCNIYFSNSDIKLSDLALANVEAFASDNEGGGITCSRTCNDGVGRCYVVWDSYGNCHFSGYQSDNCVCHW